MIRIIRIFIIKLNLRGEGDLNSRDHKIKGLAILRRSQAGPSPLVQEDIKPLDKNFMSRQNNNI